MCPRPPYFYRMPNISLRVSLMSEIALLSSRAVIVGVVHITLVVHIRPVSPTWFWYMVPYMTNHTFKVI